MKIEPKKRFSMVEILSLYWWKQWYSRIFKAYHTNVPHCECVIFLWNRFSMLEIQGFWFVVNFENRSKKSAFRWLEFCHYTDESSDFQLFSQLITLWKHTFLVIFRPQKTWNLRILACDKSWKSKQKKALFDGWNSVTILMKAMIFDNF